MTTDLFDWGEGAALRDAGMAIAAAAQDRDDAGWAERAYQAIAAVAAAQPTVHVDDVRRVFGEQPRHPNAWGAVWHRALRAGVIRRGAEFRESSDPRKHRHLCPVYLSSEGRRYDC